jgi:DNA polymerase III delta prime subunit
MMNEEFLWVEKYRPKTIEDTILPCDLKKTFQQFVDQKNIPNLILAGGAGVGKTTVARAMLEELGCDYIVINGSLEGRNIDTLRVEILNFASSVSLSGGRKYVILDEADYLNANSTQPALRNFMEQFSRNCGFILTCNYKNRIIEPLHSRCSVVEFKISKKATAKLATQFFKRLQTILEAEGIGYDQKVVAEVINKYFPDWRRVLNELQRYSATGSIDSGILANMTEASLKQLIKLMKEQNFTEMRKWVKNNTDTDVNYLYNQFYDTSAEFMDLQNTAQLVLILAKYQYQNAFSANPEINFMAFLVEVMQNCEFTNG